MTVPNSAVPEIAVRILGIQLLLNYFEVCVPYQIARAPIIRGDIRLSPYYTAIYQDRYYRCLYSTNETSVCEHLFIAKADDNCGTPPRRRKRVGTTASDGSKHNSIEPRPMAHTSCHGPNQHKTAHAAPITTTKSSSPASSAFTSSWLQVTSDAKNTLQQHARPLSPCLHHHTHRSLPEGTHGIPGYQNPAL